MSSPLEKAAAILSEAGGKSHSQEEQIKRSIELAKLLVEATEQETTRKEKKQEATVARMVADPQGKAFMTAMTDRCFRSTSHRRIAEQLVYLLEIFGLPRFLKDKERFLFLIFKWFGKLLPGFFVPKVKNQLRHEMSNVLLPEKREEQLAFIRRAHEENTTINLNHIGEAILGEEEAERRLQVYLDDMADPDIDYISVKITTIFSQVNLIGWERSLETLAERLRRLYRAAGNKFVNLDMEEYVDFDLTITVFKKVLSEPEFQTYRGGIVLQSYLPESFAVQQELTEWAIKRGHPIKIRIVKGANLAMEEVDSSMHLWELPTFDQKVLSDANFKRMVTYATEPEHARAVHIGVGSHNLFDIAYTLLLRSEKQVEQFISFEMLKGMAEPMQRVIHKLTGAMLLYSPEAQAKDFHNAVAYLIRRLDENTGPENYLRHAFDIADSTASWEDQSNRFVASMLEISSLPNKRHRTQNRKESPRPTPVNAPFNNVADTDFSFGENRRWAEEIMRDWENKQHSTIPLVIGGKELSGTLQTGIDPSKPDQPFYQYTLADESQIDAALEAARHTPPFENRFEILGNVADLFEAQRAELIGAMIADGGKTVQEADPEVFEAIDFLHYYRKNWEEMKQLVGIYWREKGTILVAPPWNFPCSIPVGGIAAALTTGNKVLFKPAPETVLIGWHLVQLFWKAGVPRETLQFINCLDEPVGSYLVKHPDLAGVILTGATETAKKLLKMRPGLDLHAETGGKNALIVSAMADRDLAVRDIIHSAFGHSGQKCSACSLAILESEVYDDPNFRRQLGDAAKSLHVGLAWDSSTKVNPLIHPPEGALLRGLTELEEGEEWLVEPHQDPHNPHLWSPGIKWGVKPGAFTHLNELFGPVLSVMRASNLTDAIALANMTPYGLTSGLHSLDEREQKQWREEIVAGNLYINRGITGAIVRRQSFGGCKASSFGPGAKAGGPNYLIHLAHYEEMQLPDERATLPKELVPLIQDLPHLGLSESEISTWKKSAESYAYWALRFKEPTDFSQIHGQDNLFYLLPREKVVIRLEEDFSLLELLQVIAACQICQTPYLISSPQKLEKISSVVEEELSATSDPIRVIGHCSEHLKQLAAERGMILHTEPVVAHGRLELLHYLREIALSHDHHRYGYIFTSS